jgi:mRNA interferase RelE/StbE
MERMDSLATDPLPRGTAKLIGAENLYRIRVGNYRIIYSVDDQAKLINVHYVRHRHEAYRDL